jgi:hypothetical protein
MPALHTSLMQSAGATQPWPSGQGPQAAEPQSMPVSALFLAPSAHVGCAHFPAMQLLLRQSEPELQAWPVRHGAHAPPHNPVLKHELLGAHQLWAQYWSELPHQSALLIQEMHSTHSF